jgi:antitoxin FitA
VASITIRNLDQTIKTRLRLRAASHDRSMEEEARDILRTTLFEEPRHTWDLATAIRRRLALLGGVEVPALERDPIREPPGLDS